MFSFESCMFQFLSIISDFVHFKINSFSQEQKSLLCKNLGFFIWTFLPTHYRLFIHQSILLISTFNQVSHDCQTIEFWKLFLYFSDLEKENKMLRDQKTCKVCLDKEVGMVFLPCGHLCCCVSCAPAVRKCPICRGEIKGTVRTYIP